ncbi:MAG: thioredoxin [Woeseiaceae bacterium]|nr:thioredoxin [Woeseiaceae bacterium]
MADSPFIIDVTRENFAQVMESSFKVPVLLDFWASWCQPCQVLMPILAKLAEEYDGRFLLAKLNTEEEQEIAAQFGIRSIPTVKLFRDGLPVDEFMGALPAEQVRGFLDQHVAHASDEAVLEARERLNSGDTANAIARLNELREADPDNPRLLVALAEAQAAHGDIEAAEASLHSLPIDERDKPDVVILRAKLFFLAQVAEAPDSAELEGRLSADTSDHEARFQLALRKIVDGDYETAMDNLLELMRQDRDFGDDAGRKGLLKVFELLGNSPLVSRYRSKMASLLH